jgi:hypothetical protein
MSQTPAGGGVTVSVAVPDTLPEVAVMVLEPTAAAVAFPLVPDVLLIVATAVFDELQVTDVVRTCVVLFEYVPVAVNCCVVPLAMLGLDGVTAIDTRVTISGYTVSVVYTVLPSNDAVMVQLPPATAVAIPLLTPALLIVATAVFDELQVAEDVTFGVVPSEYVPVAVNCCVDP